MDSLVAEFGAILLSTTIFSRPCSTRPFSFAGRHFDERRPAEDLQYPQLHPVPGQADPNRSGRLTSGRELRRRLTAPFDSGVHGPRPATLPRRRRALTTCAWRPRAGARRPPRAATRAAPLNKSSRSMPGLASCVACLVCFQRRRIEAGRAAVDRGLCRCPWPGTRITGNLRSGRIPLAIVVGTGSAGLGPGRSLPRVDLQAGLSAGGDANACRVRRGGRTMTCEPHADAAGTVWPRLKRTRLPQLGDEAPCLRRRIVALRSSSL